MSGDGLIWGGPPCACGEPWTVAHICLGPVKPEEILATAKRIAAHADSLPDGIEAFTAEAKVFAETVQRMLEYATKERQ